MSQISTAKLQRARQAYRALNDSPRQRKLRRDHPCLVGAVYWNFQEVPDRELRREMKRIRETGFTFVRFHEINPPEDEHGAYDFTRTDLWIHAAADAGLMIFPHFSPGLVSKFVLAREGLTAEQARQIGPTDPRVARAIRHRLQAIVDHYRKVPAIVCWLLGGEPHATGLPLVDDLDKERFEKWLRRHYDSPAVINKAWSIYPRKLPKIVHTWADAVAAVSRIERRAGSTALATTELSKRVFGAVRDLMRFRADQTCEHHRAVYQLIRQLDPRRMIWVGNHQLLLNEAKLGWDLMDSARTADGYYTSIHLSWHFDQVEGEVDRPVYMQARFTSDAFKGGLTSAYETTGGPVQYSGGYGNHMDAGLMRRLMLNYLAAGNESIAFWDWITRPGAIESGEYGLVTYSGKISPWAIEAGTIAQAMKRHAAEIWEASGDPELGIVRSWDSEAILTLEPGRFDLQDGPSDFSRGPAQQHLRALIGASRAAINQQVAYEYVAEKELLQGIAAVYPTLYLPHVRACSVELLETLLQYVRDGGRLIADVQVAFLDQWGKMQPRGKGTLLEQLFGAWVDTIHDARTRPQSVDGIDCPGFYGNIETTTASVVKRFADGRPAITEAQVGRGQAILVGFDPARHCWKPGSAGLEGVLGDLYRGNAPRRWWSDAPMVFRRSHRKADHWFFINDGPARSAVLRVYDRQYKRGADVISGRPVDVTGTIAIDLPEMSGAWIRLET